MRFLDSAALDTGAPLFWELSPERDLNGSFDSRGKQMSSQMFIGLPAQGLTCSSFLASVSQSLSRK